MTEPFLQPEAEAQLLDIMSKGLIGFAVLVGLGSLREAADYGKHAKQSTSIAINAKVVWFFQEVPSFAVALWFFYCNCDTMHAANKLILICFLLHYFQRSLIYPFLIKGGKPIPLAPFISAIFFTSFNGYLQGASLSRHIQLEANHTASLLFAAGICTFLAGFIINCHSDHILRNLRKPGETGYKIPRGGAFNFVSAANYFGEILEWWGLAISSGFCLPQLAFAIFTTVFLGMRGYHHHKWYLQKMDNYPKDRKAVIPFLI